MYDSRKVCFMFEIRTFIAQIFKGEYSLSLFRAASACVREADSLHTASSGGCGDASLPSKPSSPGVFLGVLAAKLSWPTLDHIEHIRSASRQLNCPVPQACGTCCSTLHTGYWFCSRPLAWSREHCTPPKDVPVAVRAQSSSVVHTQKKSQLYPYKFDLGFQLIGFKDIRFQRAVDVTPFGPQFRPAHFTTCKLPSGLSKKEKWVSVRVRQKIGELLSGKLRYGERLTDELLSAYLNAFRARSFLFWNSILSKLDWLGRSAWTTRCRCSLHGFSVGKEGARRWGIARCHGMTTSYIHRLRRSNGVNSIIGRKPDAERLLARWLGITYRYGGE